jgi:hypothetical protein
MALQCNMTLNTAVAVVGQTPAPQATLTVYNPGAVTVTVTGINLYVAALADGRLNTPTMPSVVPTGPGMATSVPSLGSITIGPFPIVVNSAGNANPAQMIPIAGAATGYSPQASQYMQFTVLVGATVYGSDGSSNTAGVAPLLVSYSPAPPPGFQGGYLNLEAPNNFLFPLMLGVL